MAFFSDNDIAALRAKKKTGKLIKILLSDDGLEQRRLAANALGSIGDKKAIEPLVQIMQSDQILLAVDAAAALGDLKDTSVVDALVQQLKSSSEELVVAVAKALGRLGSSAAVEPLAETLKSPSPGIIAAALYALGKIRDSDALQHIHNFLWHEEDNVKITAVNAILNIGCDQSIEVLQDIYKEGEFVVKEYAAKALAKLGWKPDKTRLNTWIAPGTEFHAEEDFDFEIPPKLRSMLKGRGDLPPIPEIFLKLSGIINSQDGSLKDVADLVKADSVISARVVKVANSSYYSRNSAGISDVGTCVTRLGLDQMKSIILAMSVVHQFNEIDAIDNREFWTHSFVSAQIAQTIAKIMGLDSAGQGRAYMSGLMHDIGIQVLVHLMPHIYEKFLDSRKKSASKQTYFDLSREERGAFMTDHAHVGAAYIDYWWPVDSTIVKSVMHHHSSLDDENTPLVAKITTIANKYCHGNDIHNGINIVDQPSPFDPAMFSAIGMTEKQVAEFHSVIGDEIEAAEQLLATGM